MTSYEKMLQSENRRSRKKSVRSYTILHMGAEDQEIESLEGSTLRVVEEDTLIAQSQPLFEYTRSEPSFAEIFCQAIELSQLRRFFGLGVH